MSPFKRIYTNAPTPLDLDTTRQLSIDDRGFREVTALLRSYDAQVWRYQQAKGADPEIQVYSEEEWERVLVMRKALGRFSDAGIAGAAITSDLSGRVVRVRTFEEMPGEERVERDIYYPKFGNKNE